MTHSLVAMSYIVATILFILSLSGLSNQESARKGNYYGMLGMAIAIAATTLSAAVSAYAVLMIALLIGGSIGARAALKVEMTQMPELVAIMHSLVGMAAVLVGYANFMDNTVVIDGVEKTIHELEIYLGILIGAVGLMIALAAWQGFGENDPLSIAALVGAIACYGIGGPYIRRYVTPLGVPNTVTSLLQLGVSTLFVLPFYLLTGPLFVGEVTPSIAWAMLSLGALGSGIAYVFYYRVIADAGSAIANTVTYITPLVAVFLGVLVLGEQLYWYEPVGAVVVILGAAISQGYLTRKPKLA